MNDTKDMRTLVLESIVILSAAGMFVITGDAPQTLVLVLIGLTLTFAFRKPLPRNSRTFIYAGLTAIVTMVLADQIMPVDPKRFFLMRSEIYCPALLFLAVAATFFDQRDTNVTAVITLSLLAMMLAGNVVGTNMPNKRLPFEYILFANLHLWYAGAVVIQLLAMVLLLPRARNRAQQTSRTRGHRAPRWVLVGAAVVAAAAIALGILALAHRYERQMQYAFARWMRHYMRRRSNRVVFAQDVDLWRTVPLRQEGDKQVVMRVDAAYCPGYLRGRAYRTYGGGRWSGSADSSSLTVQQMEDDRLTFNVFVRPRSDIPLDRLDADSRIDVYPARRFATDVLLVPGNAAAFELVAVGLTTTVDGALRPDEWERDAGYSTLSPQVVPDGSAFDSPGPNGAEMTPYLQIPERLEERLAAVAQDVFSTADDSTDRRVAELLRTFNRDFEYSLEAPLGPGYDPVIQFLTENRRGHCELFAASAVLLLRTQGIPARYVTGFVCNEPAQGGGHWVVRMDDAHAWAEVFVWERGTWELLEGTPASGVPQATVDSGVLGGLMEGVRITWQRVFALVKRGYVAQAIVTGVVAVGHGIWALCTHPFGAPLVLLLLARLARSLWRLQRRARAAHDRLLADPRAELQAVFQWLERRLRRRFEPRTASTTVREYVAALRADADSETVSQLTALLLEYEALRYGEPTPSAARVAAFRRKTRQLVKAAPWKQSPPGSPAARSYT